MDGCTASTLISALVFFAEHHHGNQSQQQWTTATATKANGRWVFRTFPKHSSYLFLFVRVGSFVLIILNAFEKGANVIGADHGLVSFSFLLGELVPPPPLHQGPA